MRMEFVTTSGTCVALYLPIGLCGWCRLHHCCFCTLLPNGLACQLPPLTARMMMLNQPKMIIPLTMEEICCLFQLALRPLSRCEKSQ